MTLMKALLPIALIVCGSKAIAADANKPDAASVTNAMYAAVGAGNVDAAVSFFADDAYNIRSLVERRRPGRGRATRILIRFWVNENYA